ncbi:MAG: glycosyltransferase family 4 protein [Candidatus Krumholzibacteriia bacterium]
MHLHEIFGRIARMGHAVTLVAHRFPGSPPQETLDGIRVMRVGRKFDFNFRALPFCLRLLGRERFDVAIEDLNKLPFFLAFRAKIPCCAILHHFFGSSIWRETNPVFATYVGLGEWIVKRTYRSLPFCAVSESTAAELTSSGFDPGKVRIIHNAVDHDVYTRSESVAKIPGRIVYLGRVKRYKGIDIILRSLVQVRQEMRDAHLVVVGGGDDRPRLERITRELGLGGSVRFLGHVETPVKIRQLREAQVMVTPSPKEGWGVTTIEANACGTPVIASDVPGLRDAVLDGETGLLFPFGDVPALSDRITRLLNDEALRRELTAKAIEWAGRFRWERSAHETVEWLESVIAERAH